MVTKAQFAKANARGRQQKKTSPSVLHASYNRRSRNIVLQLDRGVGIFFHPDAVEGLQHAAPAQLAEIEVTPSGLGLHFPRLDADIYLPALLEGSLGSAKWMASRLGSKGGSATSKAKAASARANGTKGGRPRRHAAQ